MFKKILKTITNAIITAVKVTIRITTGIEFTKAKETVALPATAAECDWKLMFSNGYRKSDVFLSEYILDIAAEARLNALFLFFSVIFTVFAGLTAGVIIIGYYPGLILNLAIDAIIGLVIAGLISRVVTTFAKFKIKYAY